MADMFIKIIIRLLLPLYYVVFAALPLSYIHIEAVRDTCCFAATTEHEEHNAHVLLHQIFFSHFSNRSDHLMASPADELLDTGEKRFLRKAHDTTPSLIIPASADTCVIRHLAYAALAADKPWPAHDVISLSSGLSPPAA